MLVDQFGQPLKPQARPETRTVAAASIRDRWSSYPTIGLTPGRLSQIFQDADQGAMQSQSELFEEMEEKDAHLASVLQTRKSAIMGLEWRVEPSSDGPKDQEIAEFVEASLRGIGNLEDGLLDLLDALGKGYSLVEIDWQVKQYAEPVYLRWVHPKRVTFWNSLTPGITQDFSLDGQPLAPWKFIFHRHKARSGHDTRAGVLRVVAWMYLLKNHAMKDWAVFNEIFGMPLRVGKYDPGASDGDKAALVTAIRSLGSDAAAVISKSTEIEFVEAANRQSGTANPYQLMADFCNREMSKAVLGQTLTTDTSGGTGTFAAGKVHDGVRRDILEADAEALAASLRAQLLRPMVGFNFGWERDLPYFDFILEEDEDLKSVAETYKIVKEIGFPLTLEHVSERFGVPLPKDGQELVGGGQKAEEAEGSRQRAVGSKKEKPGEGPDSQGSDAGSAPSEETADANANGTAEAAKTAQTLLRLNSIPLRDGGTLPVTNFDKPVIQAQEDLRELADRALAASGKAVAEMLRPVRRVIAAGGSLEEIRAGLLDVYPEMPTADLENLLYEVLVLANLRGRLTDAG